MTATLYALTRELISVTRSDSSVTATGVGSSLEARVACWKNNNNNKKSNDDTHSFVVALHILLLKCITCVGLIWVHNITWSLLATLLTIVRQYLLFSILTIFTYWIYFMEVILNSCCNTFINAIRIVSSRGRPKPSKWLMQLFSQWGAFKPDFTPAWRAVVLQFVTSKFLPHCDLIYCNHECENQLWSWGFRVDPNQMFLLFLCFFITEVMPNITCLSTRWIKLYCGKKGKKRIKIFKGNRFLCKFRPWAGQSEVRTWKTAWLG